MINCVSKYSDPIDIIAKYMCVCVCSKQTHRGLWGTDSQLDNAGVYFGNLNASVLYLLESKRIERREKRWNEKYIALRAKYMCVKILI